MKISKLPLKEIAAVLVAAAGLVAAIGDAVNKSRPSAKSKKG